MRGEARGHVFLVRLDQCQAEQWPFRGGDLLCELFNTTGRCYERSLSRDFCLAR
jgi:hypothetical protein